MNLLVHKVKSNTMWQTIINIVNSLFPNILGPIDEPDDVEDVIERFTKAKHAFIGLGVEPSQIKVGYTFSESHQEFHRRKTLAYWTSH